MCGKNCKYFMNTANAVREHAISLAVRKNYLHDLRKCVIMKTSWFHIMMYGEGIAAILM